MGAKHLTQHSWDSWVRGGQGLGVPEEIRREPLAALLLSKRSTENPHSDRLPVPERESHTAGKKSTHLALSEKKAYNLGFTKVGHVYLRLNLHRTSSHLEETGRGPARHGDDVKNP